MTAFERMMLRSNSAGSSIREQMINNSREEFETLLQDDPSYRNAEIIRGDNVIGSIYLRMDNRKIKNEAPQMDVYSSLSNDIKLTYGDVLHTTDVEDDNIKESYWLCIDEDNFHGIHRENLVEECNYYLPFQNQETLELHGRWCSIRSPYSSGLDEGKTVSTGNAKFDITLPYDEETKLFHKDFRFIIDYANNEPIPYKIIRFDGVSNRYASRQEGFLTIKVEEDQIQSDDNWELGIANYKSPPDPTPPSIGLCKILYTGLPQLKSGGSIKTFTAAFYESEDKLITTITPTWELDLPTSLQGADKIKIVSEIGNEIRIQATDKAPIGEVFVLKLSGEDENLGLFNCEISIEIIELW